MCIVPNGCQKFYYLVIFTYFIQSLVYFYIIYTLEFYCEHILNKIYIQGVFIWSIYVVLKARKYMWAIIRDGRVHGNKLFMNFIYLQEILYLFSFKELYTFTHSLDLYGHLFTRNSFIL